MAKAQKSIKFNFIMNAILTMSSLIFPLITFPYISRILLPEGTGKVSLATSVISYFSLFAQLGIPTYGVRACAKVRDNRIELTRTVHELLAINLMMCVLAYAALALALRFVPRLQEEKPLYVIISTTIFLTAIGMEWLYKALEQYQYITVRSILFNFIALLAMFGLVHTREDYVVYGGITILAASASNILNFLNVPKYIAVRPLGQYNIKRHIKTVGIFFAMVCATTIYTNMDTVMLGFIKTDVDVGYYNAAVKIKNILLGVVTSLSTVLLPRVSYYIEQGMTDTFYRISKKALNFTFVLTIPLCVYFTLFAKECIYFLSGPAYAGAIVPMQILMATLLCIGITSILGIQILVPLGREKTVLYSTIVGALVNIVINWILIPQYASSGAAIGTLIAEIAVLAVQCYALKNEITRLFKGISYIKILVSLLLGTAVSLWIKTLEMGIFAALLFSASLFFGIYGTSLLIAKETLITEIARQLAARILRKAGKKDV